MPCHSFVTRTPELTLPVPPPPSCCAPQDIDNFEVEHAILDAIRADPETLALIDEVSIGWLAGSVAAQTRPCCRQVTEFQTVMPGSVFGGAHTVQAAAKQAVCPKIPEVATTYVLLL